ncbi:MAG: enoyl-CoA hydratase-related protein, partial [Dehalococcoidia bacterium]|nr:enoyl-CoA hydratase-related protein [Dehalococcoidia bacterium]
AAEAKEIGLVNRVAPAGKLDQAVKEITDDLVKHKSPMASTMIKGLVDKGMQADLHTGLELEVQGILRHFRTEDCVEGIAAFREKRPPVFKGK